MNPQAPAVIELELPVAERTNGNLRPAELDVAHREAFYRTTLRSIGDAVISTDKDCQITFINPVAEKLTGWIRDEALGRKLAEVFVLVSESGEIILEDPASKVMREGHTVSLPKGVKLKTRDGRLTPIDDSSAPILDDQNRLLGVVVIFRDISLRKMGEDALRKSDKLATAGLLAATIAHEINNPLAAVTNLLFILKLDPHISESTRVNLDLMDRELSRVTLIAKQALGLHRNSVQPRSIDMRELLDELLVLYQGRLQSKKIKLAKKYDTATSITGFEGDLKQVFSNLISNAIDAMSENGMLTLQIEDSRCGKLPGIQVGVGDDGVGFSADAMEKAFEPFYTTKETGSGLGLWVVKQIVEEHGGSLNIKSQTGPSERGSCFTVCLPLVMHERPSVRVLAHAHEPRLHDRRA